MSIHPKQQHSPVQEQQQQHLPRPSPFDELSAIFYPLQQENSSFGDSNGDQSPNSKLISALINDNDFLDEIGKEGPIYRIMSSMMEGSSPAREIQPPSPEDPEARSVVLYDHQIQVVADAAAYCYQPFLLPPGFRFVPNDDELIRCYLLPFLRGYPFLPCIDIHHVDIYKYNPEELAAEFKKGNDKDEWFFITERRKNWLRPDCSANGGYWRPTGSETKVDAGKGVLGSKRTLVFHTGKQPKGTKTDWMMQEYHLDHPLPPPPRDNNSNEDNKMLDTVLCKIYDTPKGKKRRAYEEEKQEDEDEDELFSTFYLGKQETEEEEEEEEDDDVRAMPCTDEHY
ncbi:unnamed protein product [Microthlaspi erraticum]|uniref:NAC domain-containing protein n=1 Tax=Microthlaspi erraticum TaxID=1685480 RepID=A0A6D2LJP8_9BRAS|nr:unnamed protein product [Microthlaspi erraticum]